MRSSEAAPKLFQSLAFSRSECGVPMVLIGLPSPKSECPLERETGVAWAAFTEEPASLLGQPFEPNRVDLVARDLEGIPVAARDDHFVC
jgi:hypothetical protein